MVLNEKIFSNLGSLLVSVDIDGQIDYVSPSVQTVLGYSPDELVGESWWKLTGYDELQEQRSKSYLKRLLEGKVSADELQYERKLITRDGQHKWILWNATTADDRIVVLGNDITRRKEMEGELRRRQTLLEEQRTEFADSVSYAKRIQQAMLPDRHKVASRFEDGFVLHMPRDGVSGDTYWYTHENGTTWLAAIDCTGHGVPGAMLAVLANNLLREIVKKRMVSDPGTILNTLDEELQAALSTEDGEPVSTDGMDLSLIRWTKGESTAFYASAYRPILKVSVDGEVCEYDGDRFPVGYFDRAPKDFQTRAIPLDLGDRLFMFSDGFPDQFGGDTRKYPGGKKFKKKNFKSLLSSTRELDMQEQCKFLEYAFNNWKQDLPQTDDVLVVGVQPI